MRLSIRTKLFLGFGSAIAILLVVSISSFVVVGSLKGHHEGEYQTQEVVLELQTALTALVDAETGQRGYLITGDESYLDPYDTGARRVHASLDRVTHLTADNAYQQEAMGSVVRLVSDILTELNDGIQLRRTDGFAAAQAVVATNAGKEAGDELRALIEGMIAEEESQLSAEHAATAASTRLVNAIIFGGLGTTLLLLVPLILLTGAISGPIRRLQVGAARIGQGDLDVRLPEGAGDELGELAREFNSMAAHLSTKDKQLQNRTSELEAANEELRQFSYSVSHDLRTPLRSIDGFSQALLDDCGDSLSEAGKDSLRRVRSAAQRMASLIDDLLQLSRVTRIELRREPVDLSSQARAVADELQSIDPERKVEFVIADKLVANVDPQLSLTVLENLLGNSWKFTSKHATARIEFGAASQQNGSTVFFVRDDGVGFDMAYANKLFTPFQRLHTISEFPGNGIGLASVQHIVRRHGGRTWAEAEVEQGATFYFAL